MRVGPPLTAGFPKQVPPGGDIVCGKALPEGTQIWVDYLGIMNDQEVFGSDVDIFRPERFLECDAATRAKRMKVVDLIFGYGRWQCLGKVLAVMEMNKIFVEVSRLIPPILLVSPVSSMILSILKHHAALPIFRFPGG